MKQRFSGGSFCIIPEFELLPNGSLRDPDSALGASFDHFTGGCVGMSVAWGVDEDGNPLTPVAEGHQERYKKFTMPSTNCMVVNGLSAGKNMHHKAAQIPGRRCRHCRGAPWIARNSK
jgi:hypothetical protein